MTNCPNTGIAVPECSCRSCLQALIERHMPSLLVRAEAKPSTPDQAPAELTPPSELRRRAA